MCFLRGQITEAWKAAWCWWARPFCVWDDLKHSGSEQPPQTPTSQSQTWDPAAGNADRATIWQPSRALRKLPTFNRQKSGHESKSRNHLAPWPSSTSRLPLSTQGIAQLSSIQQHSHQKRACQPQKGHRQTPSLFV